MSTYSDTRELLFAWVVFGMSFLEVETRMNLCPRSKRLNISIRADEDSSIVIENFSNCYLQSSVFNCVV